MSTVGNTTTPLEGCGNTAELQQQIASIRTEVARLNDCLRYEQHRAETMTRAVGSIDLLAINRWQKAKEYE